MTYDPKKHNRKSIRLKGYDYTQAGLYFVTICCQNRQHFYGKIVNSEMILNTAGKMVYRWYYELENKFPNIKCHEMIVMPNHFHCIIQIVDQDHIEGVDPRVYPLDMVDTTHIPTHSTSLATVIQWFKTMTTNEYIRNVKSNNWRRFNGRLWQRNYWEHIIRNKRSYHRISEYIKSNPRQWKEDSLQ